MRALASAGISVDEIDFVMCTHLHVDHVGWNTRLEGGRWGPTFPNARYVFGKAEFDYWTERRPRPRCRRLSTAYCRWSRPGAPISCATTTRSAITFASCRRRVTPRARRVHFRPWQGRRGFQRRFDAFAAANALSRTVSEIRCRPGAGGAHPAQFPGGAIATPTRCAAARISPRLRPGKIRRRADGFSCEAVAR